MTYCHSKLQRYGFLSNILGRFVVNNYSSLFVIISYGFHFKNVKLSLASIEEKFNFISYSINDIILNG